MKSVFKKTFLFLSVFTLNSTFALSAEWGESIRSFFGFQNDVRGGAYQGSFSSKSEEDRISRAQRVLGRTRRRNAELVAAISDRDQDQEIADFDAFVPELLGRIGRQLENGDKEQFVDKNLLSALLDYQDQMVMQESGIGSGGSGRLLQRGSANAVFAAVKV